MIPKIPMITKFPNAISSGKILTLIFSFLIQWYNNVQRVRNKTNPLCDPIDLYVSH
jgi:hypothetical protein